MVPSQSVNIAAVSDRVDCDGVGVDREQHTPVTGAQPHSDHAFKRLDVALAGLRERCQFGINLRARSGGEFAPLARGGRSERDLFHL